MIALGSDHGGYELKQTVKKYLEDHGIAYRDYGCHDKSSCDYPEFARAAAKAVASGECEKGIVICTTGIGISIAANKVKGVRCALCSDSLSAKMTRLHNDANMLANGSRNHRRKSGAEYCGNFFKYGIFWGRTSSETY